jgi:type I restriction enzyme S subunit
MEALNAVDYSQFVAFGTRSKLTQGAMMGISVQIPPLIEQKRIVDVVSSVDTYIGALQQQADTARTARNALLHELLSAGGDDWTETTLGDIAEASWGNTTVTKKQYKEFGFTAFSASGPDGYVDWFEHDEKGVVLSAIGALCGKTWLADGKWTPIKNTIWFKSKSQACLTEYLFLVSKTPDLWPIRGQAQPFISLGDVRLIEVSLPPLGEQKRIVEIVSSMDDVIQTTEQAVTNAKNLRSGLLSDLLSGEHEIPVSYDVFVGAA